MTKEMRKNRNMRKVGRRLLSVLMALTLFISAFSGIVFFHYEPEVAKAADSAPTELTLMAIDGTELGTTAEKTYEMMSETLVLKVKSVAGIQNPIYKWTLMGIGSQCVNIDSDTNSTPQLTAKAPGTFNIKCEVTGTVDGQAYTVDGFGQIEVVFALKSNDTKYYKDVYPDDTDDEKALIIVKDDEVPLELSFPAQGSIQWHSDNEEVAKFVGATSTVKAIGAGCTTLYAHDVKGDYDTKKLKVYVVPQVSKERNGAVQISGNLEISEDKPYLYTNAVFDSGEYTIYGKVQWAIYRDIDGLATEVAHSESNGRPTYLRIGASGSNPGTQYISEFEHTSSTDNQFRMKALTGKYTLKMYVNDGNPLSKIKTAVYKTETADTPGSTVTILVKGPVKDKTVTLGVGDTLDLAESYQMTKDDFNKVFNPTVDDNTIMDDVNSKCESVAKKEGQTVIRLSVSQQGSNYASQTLGMNIPEGTVYKTTVSVINGLTLSEKNLTLWEGQEKWLEASRIGTSVGMIARDVYWESSDPNFVKVTPNENNNTRALLKAEKETSGKKITITAYFFDDGGIKRTTNCEVIVEKAVKDFTLDPKDEPMKVNLGGDPRTVKAEFTGTANVTEAPLRWISSNEKVFTVSVDPASGNKMAEIKPVGGGRATLIVENTLSGVRVDKEIEVVIPIEKIEMPEEMTFPFYQLGHNMMKEIEITPSDATSKDLEWSLKPAGLAEVDESGYMKFNSPGQFILTVIPKTQKNPADLVYAKSIITITAGPDEIIFDNLKDGHLDIEAGETKLVDVKFVPETSQTDLIWKTDKAGVVHLDWKEEKRQLEVVGQKPGSCTVTCRTQDNVYYSFTVTCTEASEGIEFEKDTITLYNGDPIAGKYQLVPKLKPETSTDTVSYKVRDEKIATVNNKGLVTAVAAGKTYVSATTSSGKTAIVDVIVIDKVTKVTGDFKRANVYIGESLTISPTVLPETASNKSIKWSWEPFDMDDPGSVELEERGTEVIVTGKTAGMVVLTGVSEDNSSAYVEYTLTVKYRNPQYKTKVTLSPKTKYVNVGKRFRVSRSVKNAYNGNRTLRWKSSNRKVATVSSSGRVRARRVGKATITAMCLDGSKAKGSMKVVVRRLVSKIKMNRSSANILVGRSVRLSVRVTPSNATIKGVTWKSGDTSIATVDGGKVIGVAPGMVKITATSKDATKKKTYCWVTVSEPVPVTNFTIADANLTVAKGSSIQSGMLPNPTNATDSIKYWSDTPSVATVTSKGKIKGIRPGKATIYARAANGVEGHVDVTVVDINRKAVTLLQYATEQLSIYNITANITWYSSRPEIASVDANGLVKAKLPGTAIIYAVVDGVKLGCKVTVKRIT